MPKKNAKAEESGKKAGAKIVKSDDDFDVMLEELRAADLTTAASASTSRNGSSTPSEPTARVASASVGTSMPSTNSTTAARTTERTNAAALAKISDGTVVDAVIAGSLNTLRKWGKWGMKFGPVPLCIAAGYGKIDVLRCLAKEFGADVNQATEAGLTPLLMAATEGKLDVLHYLVNELGVNVHQTLDKGGTTSLHVAARQNHLDMVRCLVNEFHTDVNQRSNEGYASLHSAAELGLFDMARCLVKELGADVNIATRIGSTPLMLASVNKHHKLVTWLLKNGANAQMFSPICGTAADASKLAGASIEQTAYLEAKTHCANPGCRGAGLKKCAGCLEVFFCGPACIKAHWPAHKTDCERRAREKKEKDASSSSSSS
jgi:hypothetical protein